MCIGTAIVTPGGSWGRRAGVACQGPLYSRRQPRADDQDDGTKRVPRTSGALDFGRRGRDGGASPTKRRVSERGESPCRSTREDPSVSTTKRSAPASPCCSSRGAG